MSLRHDTPAHVAAILARFIPSPCRSVLDPAVGSGILVEQFLRKQGCGRIECIDVDRDAILNLASCRRFSKVKVRLADFVQWASSAGSGNRKRFDCIVMNPPFAGTKDKLVPIVLPDSRSAYVPIKAAFVFRSLRLLRAGGRLISIVPASIISGTSMAWLRALLMRSGNVLRVHELPNWTFSGVDGKIYILVYEHGQPQRSLAVCNHRLISPDVIRVKKSRAESLARWDFGYVHARRWHESLPRCHDLTWTALGDACEVSRGRIESPIIDAVVLHTTNLSRARFPSLEDEPVVCDVQPGDLIMKRVGRKSAFSPVLFRGSSPVQASDCVLRIRPVEHISPIELLFALRTIVSWPSGAALIERGVGAKYVTVNDLRSIEIPMSLGKMFPGLLRQYKTLIADRRWRELPTVEARARKALSGIVKGGYA